MTAEQGVEDLKALHDQSLQAAAQAKKAVEQNAMTLQAKVAERTKLLSQLEQAKMQERVSESLRSMDSTLSAPGNTPSLDAVRDKIERRYATHSALPNSPRTPFKAHDGGPAGLGPDGRAQSPRADSCFHEGRGTAFRRRSSHSCDSVRREAAPGCRSDRAVAESSMSAVML